MGEYYKSKCMGDVFSQLLGNESGSCRPRKCSSNWPKNSKTFRWNVLLSSWLLFMDYALWLLLSL